MSKKSRYLTDEAISRIKVLDAEGHSPTVIAEDVGFSYPTILRVLKTARPLSVCSTRKPERGLWGGRRWTPTQIAVCAFTDGMSRAIADPANANYSPKLPLPYGLSDKLLAKVTVPTWQAEK